MTFTLEPISALPPVVVRDRKMDFLQFKLGQLPQVEAPVTHLYTPGAYTRQIFMHAGSLIISRVHRTRHPYVISQGRCRVWSEQDGLQTLAAPHTGITTPGTRRVLFILEDCIWTTFHAGPWEEGMDPEKIADFIIEPHSVDYVGALENELRGVIGDAEPKGIAG